MSAEYPCRSRSISCRCSSCFSAFAVRLLNSLLHFLSHFDNVELSQQLFFYFLLCVVPFCLSPRCGLHCLAGSLACVYDMHAHDMGDNRGTVRYQIFQIDIQVNFSHQYFGPGPLVGRSFAVYAPGIPVRCIGELASK